MLVRAFKVEVGARPCFMAKRMRAAQHVNMCCARIKPDIQRIGHFLILRGVIAQQRVWGQAEPGVNSLLFNQLRYRFHEFDGARVQFARFAVQKEGNRHAPVALTRDAPVGPLLNHALETRLAPCGDKLGIFHALLRRVAQRGLAPRGLVIHAHKPLCRRAIDKRCFVAPAVHIAVR